MDISLIKCFCVFSPIFFQKGLIRIYYINLCPYRGDAKGGDNPNMDMQTLRPRRERIEATGKISYQESTHSWSQLNLKKAILAEFPQLKERMSSFGYKMIFYQDYNMFEKFIRKLKREKEVVPILMWLVKEKTNHKIS